MTMQNKLLLLLTVLLSSSGFSQQSGWISQNEVFITSKNISGVHQFDVNAAIVVGADGLVMKTANGGASFVTIQAGTTSSLLDVFFVTPQTGWAVGDNGTVLKSTNSGDTWNAQSSGSTSSLLTVHFIDANTGWIGGADGKIRKTTDGGASWNLQTTGASVIRDIRFQSATFGLAAGYIGNAAYMFRTTDGGTTWTSTWLNSGWGYGVHIVNENIAWGVGETARITTVSDPFGGGGTTITDRKSVRWKTTNGGQSWAEVASTTSRFYSKIFFLDQNNGWAAGTNGAVVRTTDAGATWYQYSVGSTSSLSGVFFTNNQAGYAVGANGLISKTTDAGGTWARVSGKPTNSDLSAACFLNVTTGWIGGSSYEVLKTTDGGASWQMLPTAFTSKVNALSFSDASTGCAAVSSTIYRTTDGGQTWPKSTYIYSEIKSLWFIDPSIGYAVGASGKIVKTTNGGVDWQTQTSGISDGLTSVHFVDASTGWAAGSNGRILKTTNGGTQWTAQMSGVTDTLWSVRFTDVSKGFAVGRNGIILSTTDGGAQWSRMSLEVTQSLYSINFSNATTGWIAGSSGVVLKTTDGGLSWGRQTSGTSQKISTIVFADNSTGWIVGSDGLIMKTADGGGSASFPPSLLSPANRVTGLSKNLQLRWNTISGAQSYRVQVSQSSSFSSTVTDQSGVTALSLNVSNLLENTIYYWRVKAEYGQTSSDWSAVWCFATGSTAGWNIQIAGTKNSLTGVYFVNERVGWAVGEYGTIIKTTDGGVNWNAQSSTLTYTFSSVQFRDTLKGWLLAERSNIILKTTNGGTSWERSDAPYSELYTLYFVDDQNGWAAGLNGTIVKTANGGTSWTQQSTGQAKQLNAIHFVDALYGWAAGSNYEYKALLLRTTDGGVTWMSVPMESSSSISDIWFVDRNTGFAIGGSGGQILKTTDGGISWSKYTVNINYSSLSRIRFLNQNVGWTVGGAGYVFKTTDGGQTWGPQTSSTTSYVNDIHFVDATRGWMVGGGYSEGGIVLQTANSGGTVMVPPRPVVPPDRSIGLTTSQQVVWTRALDALSYKLTCSGLSYNVTQSGLVDTSFVLTNLSPNTIYRWSVVAQYQNGVSAYSPSYWFATTGTAWSAQICGTTNSLNSVFFIDASTGWAVGGSYSAGEIYKTSDGGATWSAQQNPSQKELNKIQFIDKYKGWAVGGDYSTGIVLATTDGGATWSTQSVNPGKEITDLYFIDAQTGWFVGWGGLIYKTIDGGANWTPQASGTTGILYGVHFVNSLTGWVVGYALLKTMDGGATWTTQTTTLGTLFDIYAFDAENALVASYGGSIAKTTDGGITWLTQFSNSSVNLTSVSFADSKIGWVSGTTGTILKTTDGGVTWGFQRPEINQYFKSVFCINGSTAWVASLDGTILKTANGGGAVSYLPSIPSLVSPVDAQLKVPSTPTIQWNASKEALSYDVEVSINASFSPLAFSKQGISDTSCSPTGLLGGTTYRWRVKANNPAGSSDWSSVWSFTTIMQAPAVPTLSSPPHGATGLESTPTIIWSPSAGASKYRLQIAKDSVFSSIIVDDSTITSTFAAVGPLEGGVTFYCRVCASNADGVSDWSVMRSFSTIKIVGPPVPTLFSPFNTAAYLSSNLVVQWKRSRGASSYRLQISGLADFSILALDKSLTDTLYSVTGLSSGTTYYWRVNATDTSGTSVWSSIWKFTVGTPVVSMPATPSLLSPGNSAMAVSANPEIKWVASTGAVSYRLQVSTTTTFQALVFDDSTLTVTERQIGPLARNTAYYWRVRAKNSVGSSIWSTVWSFTTILAGPAGPVLSSPLQSTMGAGNSITLRWRSSEGAVSYKVQLSINSTFSANLIDLALSDTSYTVNSLSPQTTYYWRVQAIDINGAANWSEVWSFATAGAGWKTTNVSGLYRSISFAGSRNGWMAGSSGILATTDGGANWKSQSSGTGSLESICFVDSLFGWAVGSASKIVKTTNGGTQWISQSSGVSVDFRGVSMSDANNGWAVAEKTILHTTNGGLTWESQTAPTMEYIYGVRALSSTKGIVYGGNLILRTTNGGATWTSSTLPAYGFFQGANFLNENTGWAVGADGVMFKTTNGGIQWSVVPSGTSDWITSIHFINEQQGWAVGWDGLILKTTDAGSTWGRQLSGTKSSFYGVHFIDAFNGWAVGGQNMKTSDGGGVSFFAPVLLSPSAGATNTLTQPTFQWNAIAGVVSYQLQVATGSYIYSGNIVVNDSALTSTTRQTRVLNSNQTYYWRVLGYLIDGSVLYSPVWSFRTGSSSTSVEDIAGLPGTYYLYQNYPNPFNPSTIIRFSLPKSAHVNLKIISILGQEMATLIDESKGPGQYEVRWNAADAPSGVYFYRLQAAEFVDTKRMILLR